MPPDLPKSDQKKARKAASRPAVPSRLLDAAVAIHLDPDAIEAAFMAKQLVQCTLPHTNPGDVAGWSRRNGHYTLTLQPGVDETNKVIGYPFGIIPRLLLFWITTEVVRMRERRIELGNTLSDFMWELGFDPHSRGKRSDAKRLRDQMERLFSCRMSFHEALSNEKGHKGKRWMNMEIAPEGELWWDPRAPGQSALWGSWIELGERFFHAILTAPVPVDMRALRGLRRSPLALDFYAWANYRVFTLHESQFIPWRSLMQQMGAGYTNVWEFARKAQAALRAVKEVSHIKISFPQTGGGLWLHPSQTAIPRRTPRTIAP
jgi:hypothetical protein